jgi:hypothetical protein
MILVPVTVHSMSTKPSQGEKRTQLRFLRDVPHDLSAVKRTLCLPFQRVLFKPCHYRSGVVRSAGISAPANSHRESAPSAKSKKSGSNALSEIFSFLTLEKCLKNCSAESDMNQFQFVLKQTKIIFIRLIPASGPLQGRAGQEGFSI